MARTHDTSPNPTRTETTPPTSTRSAGGTRPPGAPRTAPTGPRSSGAWAWVVGLLVAFAVVWFIWWWWTGQDVEAEPDVAVSAVHELSMIVPAVDRNFSDAYGIEDPFGLRELPQVA